MGFQFLFYFYIFIYFFKYETIVSRNGLSLGYSERDTSSVYCLPMIQKFMVEQSGVEKFMVEKSGVERSEVEAWT